MLTDLGRDLIGAATPARRACRRRPDDDRGCPDGSALLAVARDVGCVPRSRPRASGGGGSCWSRPAVDLVLLLIVWLAPEAPPGRFAREIESRGSTSHRRPHLGLEPIQPDSHAHFAVHRHGGGHMRLSLVWPRRLQQQLAKMEMTVGNERTHAELVGQSQGFPMAALRPTD